MKRAVTTTPTPNQRERGITRENELELVNELCITQITARELLILAGGDTDLVVQSSQRSEGLDQCKAMILDQRINKVE